MDELKQQIQAEEKQICGTVINIVYQNSENGYTVLRLRTGDDTVMAVGCMPGIVPGEQLVLTGSWVTHQSYGEQFRADTVQSSLPEDEKSIFEYLAFGAVKGIGPVLAASITKEFGKNSIKVLDEEPDRLAEIKGISPKMARRIGLEFRKQAGLRKLMEFLTPYGIKPLLAVKLYKCYGAEAENAVKDNPYLLTEEYFGADFFEADELALGLGFEEDCHQRIEAAVVFELRHNLNNGHSFIPDKKLISATSQLIGVEEEQVSQALEALNDAEEVITDELAGLSACYLHEIHTAETYVAERIADMAAARVPLPGKTGKLISDIENAQGIKYADAQRDAVEAAAESRIMILTGGPGTGKTTAVRGILALFDKMGLNTALTAPTGRAAKRMSEVADREAVTVHRLLGAGYSGEDGALSFEHDEEELLDFDAIILDEASMVDIILMNALLRAMKRTCRLVLVGDADQLPSVGPGNVFSDIIKSGVVPAVKLTEIFRQARESRIVKNAHLINQGLLPDIGENKGDFFFMQRPNKEKAAETIVKLCAERLPKNMNIPSSQIQVLSPAKRSETGTIELNRRLQAAINPPDGEKKEKEFGEFVFREGDRVMQIRNNYDIIWKKAGGSGIGAGVFNGDIGRIEQIDSQREEVTVIFDEKTVKYPFEMLGELEPAYAMTVHKSQGSEYRAVVLAVSRQAPMLLTRGVLYTAVTRAKELIIVVGDGEIFSQMITNDRRQRRYSGLRIRLSGTKGK